MVIAKFEYKGNEYTYNGVCKIKVDDSWIDAVMYSRDGKSRLATIRDDSLSSMYQAVCNGVEAIIEWEMIFKCVK